MTAAQPHPLRTYLGCCDCMSGLGPIQRRIRRAFIAKPGALLTTGDLVAWCYPRLSGRTLCKHRFAIRRAAESVAVRAGRGWRGSIVWRAKPPAPVGESEVNLQKVAYLKDFN